MKVILYYFFSILIILLSINLIFGISKRCPKKIGNILKIMMLLIIVRYIGFIYLGITNSNNIALLLKPINNLNMIFVPTIFILGNYVFFRNNKMKISSTYPYLIVFMVIYLTFLYFSKYVLVIANDFGFLLVSSNSMMEQFILDVILGFILLIIFYNISKPHVNKIGLFIEMLAISVTIIEIFLSIYNKGVFPIPVVGEVLAVLVAYYINDTFAVK